MLVMHEGEALRKAKQPKSAAANTNREKKKMEISSLFKMIVRLANKSEFQHIVLSFWTASRTLLLTHAKIKLPSNF